MSTQSAGQQVVLVGPNGQTEPVSLEQLDIYASVLGTESDAFSNISKAGDVLSDMYDKTEAALASTYDNASQVVSEGYKSVSDWAGNTSDAAKQWGQDTYEVVEQWGVETADATRTKVIQLSEDAQLKWDAFKKEAEIAKEQAAAKAEELATKTGEFIEESSENIREYMGNKGIQFSSCSARPTYDAESGNPAPACISMEPCCVYSGKIQDKTNPARYIEWPYIKGKPTSLLLVGLDIHNGSPSEEIVLEVKGQNNSECGKKYDAYPNVTEVSRYLGEQVIVEEKVERKVKYDQDEMTALFLLRYIPASAIGALLIAGKLMQLCVGAHRRNGYSYSINQCVSNPCFKTLSVYNYPAMKVNGNFKVAPTLTISSSGIDLDEDKAVSGSLQGQYGQLNFSKGFAVKETSSLPDNAGNASGILGILADVIDIMSGTVSSNGADDGDSNYTSRVEIKPAFNIDADIGELKRNASTPDLNIAIGIFKITLALGVSGIIDVIDTVAAVVNPGAKVVIRKARKRFASGEDIKGKIEANIVLSAEGEVTTEFDSKNTLHVLSDGKTKFENEPNAGEIKSKMAILGVAEIIVNVEAKVQVLEAALGVNGSLNTAWVFEYKTSWDIENKKYIYKKRNYFEGLKVKLLVEYEIGWGDSDVEVQDDSNSIDFDTEEIETSDSMKNEAYVQEFVIMEPTVERVYDDIPEWKDSV